MHARSRATWINCDAALVEPTDEVEREVDRAIGTNVRGTVGCWNEGDREGKGFPCIEQRGTVRRSWEKGEEQGEGRGGGSWIGEQMRSTIAKPDVLRLLIPSMADSIIHRFANSSNIGVADGGGDGGGGAAVAVALHNPFGTSLEAS